MSIRKSLLLGAATSVMALQPFCAIAAAQTADAPAGADDADDDNNIIIVTAQRREGNLQDTPISLSVVGAADLKAGHVQDLQDIAGSVPGLVISSTGSSASHAFSIRGISPSSVGTTIDDPVGVYIDGVYVGRAPGVMTDLNYIDRIEVLRGPQGTLYGRNASAGTVNIHHKRPGDELEGEVRASWTTEDDVRVKASIGGPIAGDKVRGAVAIAYTDQAGYSVNLFDGSPTNSQKSYNFYGTLELAPTEDVSVIMRADYTDLNTVDGLKRISFGTPSVVMVGDPDEFDYNDGNFADLRIGGISMTANADLGAVTFESITAYRFFNLASGIDSDGTSAEAINTLGFLRLQNNNPDQIQQQISQEFRLVSNTDGPLSWQVGLYGYRENGERNSTITNFTGGYELNRHSISETRSVALFGEANYVITPGLTLTGGLRFSHETKEISRQNDNADLFFDPPRPQYEENPLVKDDAKWSAITPKFSLLFEPSDDISFYLSASNGFKSGGYNDSDFKVPFDQEKVWSYEAGVKVALFDRRVNASLGAFYTDYKGLQVNVSTGIGIFQILNAADATLKGVEFEMSAHPFDNFKIQASGAYLSAIYGRFDSVGGDVSGNTLKRAPKWSGSVTAEYTIPISDTGGSIGIRGSVAHKGSMFFTQANVDTYSVRAVQDVNARIGYTAADESWSIAAIGKNLTNTRYATNVISLARQAIAGFNRPREFGVEVGFKF